MNFFKVLFILTAILMMNIDESAAADKNPRYEMTVTKIDAKTKQSVELGKILLELYPDKAPKHVKNFENLVAEKFYDGCAFHRVIPGFMIQGGDPNTKDKPRETWGMGAPGQTKVPAEFNDVKHVPGILSAARTNDPNSATSQFFLMHGVAPHLDGQYTVYGKAIQGLELIDVIAKMPKDARDNPYDKITFTIKKVK